MRERIYPALPGDFDEPDQNIRDGVMAAVIYTPTLYAINKMISAVRKKLNDWDKSNRDQRQKERLERELKSLVSNRQQVREGHKVKMSSIGKRFRAALKNGKVYMASRYPSKHATSGAYGHEIDVKKYNRRHKKYKSWKQKVDAAVKKLNKNTPKLHTYLTMRDYTLSVASAINNTNYGIKVIVDNTEIEGIYNSLDFFNPALPATNTSTNVTTVPRPTSWPKVDTFSRILLRNNNTSVAKINVYVCCAKDDGAASIFGGATGCIDLPANLTIYNQASGAGAATWSHPCVYPSMIQAFTDNWEIKEHWKFTLSPGDEIEHTYTNSQVWNQETADIAGANHLRGKAFYWLIRVIGCLGHENSASVEKIGFVSALVDCQIYNKMKVRYTSLMPGGKTYEYASALDAMAGGALAIVPDLN